MKSLQTKITLMMLGCILFTALSVFTLGFQQAGNILDRDSERIIQLLCSDTAAELNETLRDIEQSVHTMANFAEKQMKEKKNTLFVDREQFREYIGDMQAISLNVAEYTPGAMSFYYRFNPNISKPLPGYFMTKLGESTEFTNAPLTDLKAYTPEQSEYVGWYYEPIAAGKPTWMDPYYKASIGFWIISYVIPLFHEGETIGVIGMDIDIDFLRKIAADVSVYDTGFAMLIDGNDNIVYHPDWPNGLKKQDFNEEAGQLVEALSGVEEAKEAFHYSWKGQEQRVFAEELSNGMDFYIIVPLAEIDAPRQQLLSRAIAITVTVLFLAVFVISSFAQRITTPLRQLTMAAGKIAEGDLDVEVECSSKDEVGVLAESFKQTAESLKNQMKYINELAYMDMPSGLGNKAAYSKSVKHINDTISRKEGAFAVLVMDLNNLKIVNDTFGHEAGDILIKDASDIIKRVFGSDCTFRVGGDEFAVILTGEALGRCQELLKDFEQEVEQANLLETNYKGLLQIAIGLACYDARKDASFEDVFRRADALMYENKVLLKNEINYRCLTEKEIERELFAHFVRRQEVNDCYRKSDGKWQIKSDPFVDDWSEADYAFLVDCLKNTIVTGGFVMGAFWQGRLKGFISVEAEPVGSNRDYLDLSAIHVSQDMRGSGIGKTLFGYAREWAGEKGAKKLYISSHSAVETQRFYEAMGCVDAVEYNEEHVRREPYDRQLECLV